MNRTIALFCILTFHLFVSAIAYARDYNMECRAKSRGNGIGTVRLRQMGDLKRARIDMHDLPGKQMQVIYIPKGMRSDCTRRNIRYYMERFEDVKPTLLAKLNVGEDGKVKAQIDLSALNTDLNDVINRGLVFATENRKTMYGCCELDWLTESDAYDAMEVRNDQTPLPLPFRAEFSGKCQTKLHGKILFREEDGVKTARASLHGVPGKQLKLVWVRSVPRYMTLKSIGGRNPGYDCDKPGFARLVKNTENKFTVATLNVRGDKTVRDLDFSYVFDGNMTAEMGSGSLILTNEKDKIVTCCRIGLGNWDEPQEFQEMTEEAASYAKCEWDNELGRIEGGLHFKEIILRDHAERTERMTADKHNLIRRDEMEFRVFEKKVFRDPYHCNINFEGEPWGQQLDNFQSKSYRWCEFKELPLANITWRGVQITYGENFQKCCNVNPSDLTKFDSL